MLENLIYSMADLVSLMKTLAPIELWVIILGGITSFLIMEYSDRKRQRDEKIKRQGEQTPVPKETKPKSVRYATLKKRVKSEYEHTRQYKTTYKDIKKVFQWINEAVFDTKLAPFNEITIRDLRPIKCFGQVTQWEWKRKGTQSFHLEMADKYKNKKEFISTLAHEMVHLYQMRNAGDSGNHNALFYSFKKPMSRAGIDMI